MVKIYSLLNLRSRDLIKDSNTMYNLYNNDELETMEMFIINWADNTLCNKYIINIENTHSKTAVHEYKTRPCLWSWRFSTGLNIT